MEQYGTKSYALGVEMDVDEMLHSAKMKKSAMHVSR